MQVLVKVKALMVGQVIRNGKTASHPEKVVLLQVRILSWPRKKHETEFPYLKCEMGFRGFT